MEFIGTYQMYGGAFVGHVFEVERKENDDARNPEIAEKAMSLPFKLTAQTRGAQKAHKEFVKYYGKAEGERIYLQKAEDLGTGTTIRQKVNAFTKRAQSVDGSRR